MQYELIAILGIILCLLILGLEYLWIAILAKKQEDKNNKDEATTKKSTHIVEGILYSPSESSRESEIKSLKKLMNEDLHNFEIINAQLCFWDEYGDESEMEEKREIIDKVYEELDPVSLYGEILKKNDKYNLGYACRRLAVFDAYEYLNDIYELSKSKKRNVSYDAAMALSRLGYTEGVAEYILKIQNDKKYSFRIVNELFDTFSNDRAELAQMVLDQCDEYMKIVVIKAIVPYKFAQFEQMFIDGTVSKNSQMRIACIKALGMLADPKNEHLLSIAAKDKDWVVRSSAVASLKYIGTPTAVETIKEATKDKEWWVRQTAAKALVDMDVNISVIEDILSGYDKYASDAAKNALYRSLDLNQ